MEKIKNKKVILAFSGGLDTSFCAFYLKEQGYSVITVTVDTGGFSQKDIEEIEKQAKRIGSVKHIFIDGKKELYDKFVSYIIKGNILRGGVYPLCVGPERIIIAEKIVQIAKYEKAIAVGHGSTGAGNDHVRFDIALKVLASEFEILAPIRDLGITREEELQILQRNSIVVPKASKIYSINKGLLGTTIGGKEINDSWNTIPESAYPSNIAVKKMPSKDEEIIIYFEKGLPKRINHKSMTGVNIMEFLNTNGLKHGIGKGVHLGNTILGIKGRIAFEAPAATILIKAHTELEKLVLTKWQLFWKETLCNAYGNFLHEALYFDPIIKNIEAFIDNSQEYVTGDVKVYLGKRNFTITGSKSPYSLINQQIAIYGDKNSFWDGKDAKGFTKLYGLQSILSAKAKKLAPKIGNSL